MNVASRCYCCRIPQQETLQHLFLTGSFATEVWNIFRKAAGLQMNMVQIHQTCRLWWRVECGEMVKPILQAVPSMITWELWKRRNSIKYGGQVSFERVMHEINVNLMYLTKMRYPWLENISFLWPDLVEYLEGYKPIVIAKTVQQKAPFENWYKCNTDGASRGNPGPSSYGLCVRNWHGDLVFAECKEIGDTTNIVDEARAILKGLSYCVDHELHPLILETDYMLMKKVVEGDWKIPCVISLKATHWQIFYLTKILFLQVRPIFTPFLNCLVQGGKFLTQTRFRHLTSDSERPIIQTIIESLSWPCNSNIDNTPVCGISLWLNLLKNYQYKRNRGQRG